MTIASSCQFQYTSTDERCDDDMIDISNKSVREKEEIIKKSNIESMHVLDASEECKQTFNIDYNTYKNEIGLMGIRDGRQSTKSESNENSQANQRMRHKGCGNLYENITRINKLKTRLVCHINKNVTCQTIDHRILRYIFGREEVSDSLRENVVGKINSWAGKNFEITAVEECSL